MDRLVRGGSSPLGRMEKAPQMSGFSCLESCRVYAYLHRERHPLVFHGARERRRTGDEAWLHERAARDAKRMLIEQDGARRGAPPASVVW